MRILLIDDEVRRAEALMAYFEEICEWEVELATDPDQAMAAVERLLAESPTVDVILLDIMMEPGSGSVVPRMLSRAGRDTGLVLLGVICEAIGRAGKKVPIIVYTARIDLQALHGDPRVARYIQKPRSAIELEKDIEDILGRLGR